MKGQFQIGTDAVLARFDLLNKTPYFSVWSGSSPLCSWTEENAAGGRDMLHEIVSDLESSGTTDAFKVKLHQAKDKDGFISAKTPVYAVIDFRPVAPDYQGGSAMTGIGGYYPNNPHMRKILEDLEIMKTQITTPMDPEPDNTWLSGIERVMAIPGVAENLAPIVAGALGGILGKFGIALPPMPAGQPVAAQRATPAPATAMGSIGNITRDPGDTRTDQEIKTDAALEILEGICPDTLGDDLLKLASMAQTNRPLFDMVLTQLRSYGS